MCVCNWQYIFQYQKEQLKKNQTMQQNIKELLAAASACTAIAITIIFLSPVNLANSKYLHRYTCNMNPLATELQ